MKSLGIGDARGLARHASVQAHYSIATRDIEHDLVPLLVEEGLGLPVWSPLSGGLLSGKFGPDAAARMEKLKTMEPRKIVPLAVYLCSDASRVTGQIFGVRANEIYLFSQPRVIRSAHRGDGWTPESIAEHAIPAMQPLFCDNVPAPSLTTWDPI